MTVCFEYGKSEQRPVHIRGMATEKDSEWVGLIFRNGAVEHGLMSQPS